jgi:proteic killer suppression protein
MITGFANKATETIWRGYRPPELPASLSSVALRKLRQLDAATDLSFLKVPPGNKLHRLTKDRDGQYAIRINRQYRLCFRWHGKDADQVEITDYH